MASKNLKITGWLELNTEMHLEQNGHIVNLENPAHITFRENTA